MRRMSLHSVLCWLRRMWKLRLSKKKSGKVCTLSFESGVEGVTKKKQKEYRKKIILAVNKIDGLRPS
jgi:hypothetical protein